MYWVFAMPCQDELVRSRVSVSLSLWCVDLDHAQIERKAMQWGTSSTWGSMVTFCLCWTTSQGSLERPF